MLGFGILLAGFIAVDVPRSAWRLQPQVFVKLRVDRTGKVTNCELVGTIGDIPPFFLARACGRSLERRFGPNERYNDKPVRNVTIVVGMSPYAIRN